MSREVLTRIQHLQQIEHPASAVSRFCRQVPTSLTGRRGARSTDQLSRLSNLAFGYRMTPRGLARRAPSAGAMYPIEVAWLTRADGRWVVRYFDAAQGVCLDTGRDARVSAEELGLVPGQHAMVLIAVAWRTIQRYGLRGYRYCNLDAGNVLANAASVVVASGARIHMPHHVPHERIRAELGLNRDELVLGVAVVEGDPGTAIPSLGSRTPPGEAKLFGTEQPPMLAPAMERVRRLHQQAEPADQHQVDFGALLGGRSAEQAVADIVRRSSARSFAASGLSADALAGTVGRITKALPGLEVRVVERPRGDLAAIFGDQPLAVKPPVHVVLGSRESTLPAYRRLLLDAGLACGAMYQFAARAGLATTTFGGFSDRQVADLAGGGFRPIVVQSFGHTSGGAPDEKNDTVAATWLGTRKE